MTGYFHDPELKRKQCKFFNKTVQTCLKINLCPFEGWLLCWY